MDKISIAVLLGTTREGRLSENAARLVVSVGAELENVETVLVDPRNYKFAQDGHNDGMQDPEFEVVMSRADGFFIVSPEYNHSYPPSLKRMLDSENKTNYYSGKPVSFGGVSDGPWGGVRMIESLLPTVRTLGMYALKRDVHFPEVQNIFDTEGNLLDEKYIERIKKTYQELILKARILKYGRENMSST